MRSPPSVCGRPRSSTGFGRRSPRPAPPAPGRLRRHGRPRRPNDRRPGRGAHVEKAAGERERARGRALRYAAADAKLGQPEIGLGVIPGAGGTQRLVRLLGPGRTRELVYSGRTVDAQQALRIGLVERVVPPEEVLSTAVEDARRFANGPRVALAAAKAAIAAAITSPGAPGLQAEREAFLALFGTPDQREGMAAFLEKRAPRFGA